MIEMRPAATLRALGLHLRPHIFVDNSQLRHFLPVPLTFRVVASDALAGCRVFQEALPIVDDRALV